MANPVARIDFHLPDISGARKIGEILREAGDITDEQIQAAKELARDKNIPFGEALLRMKVVTEDVLARAIADQAGVPYMSPNEITKIDEVDGASCSEIGFDVLRKFQFIILTGRRLLTVNPFNTDVTTIVEGTLGTEEGFQIMVAAQGTIQNLLDKAQARSGAGKLRISEEEFQSNAARLNAIIEAAVRRGASDIHFHPVPDRLLVEFRQGGHLAPMTEVSDLFKIKSEDGASLMRVLKQMFDMDVGISSIVQDGHGTVTIPGLQPFDVRASLIPTIEGESVVLRLLIRQKKFESLPALGIAKRDVAAILQILREPNGMFIVTGPTGSGKTTTIYASLQELHKNRPGQSIITIEDPVEYRLDFGKQIQITAKAGEVEDTSEAKQIGVSFLSALRASLRHDPDIDFIGEMRDERSAQIAVRAALTGHFVISTLHANSALAALERLDDMKLTYRKMANVLVGLSAQRLARRPCHVCGATRSLTQEELDQVQIYLPKTATPEKLRGRDFLCADPVKAAKTKCPECQSTGYEGRVPVTEVLIIDSEIRDMIRNGASPTAIEDAARNSQQQFRTMREHFVQFVMDMMLDPRDMVGFG